MAKLQVCGLLRVDGGEADALRPKERGVLAAIAFDHPRPVPTARVADLVWAGSPPATAPKAIHNHLARLRRVAPDLVATGSDGYRLAPHVELDDGGLQAAARSVDTGSPVSADRLGEVIDHAGGVLFADLPVTPEVEVRRARHRRRYEVVREGHVHALLTEDRNETAAVVARDLVETAPDNERRWWLLALALARTGRRREALAALGAARHRLAASGLDPGADLAALERLVATGDPVLASPTVLHPSGASGLDGTASGPVGVAALLDDLEAWLTEPGGHAAATLVGPAGSGKTTVAGAAVGLARQHGSAVLTVGCDPEPARPLQPLVEVLEALAGRDPDRFATAGLDALGVLSPVLAEAVGAASIGPEASDLLVAVERAFATAVDRPTCVVVEDLHWAPPLTVQALGAACRGAAVGCSVRFLFTTRPADEAEPHAPPPGPGGAVLAIEPWTVADVEAWLAAHEPVAERRLAAARWLHGQTGGRPLFVRELTLDLLRDHRLGSAASGAFAPPDDAPPAVVAALAARVDRLGPAAVHALEVAAAVGARVPRGVLERVSGVSAAGVTEAVRAGMLTAVPGDDGVLAFEHELLRRAVLDRLAPAVAAEVHHLVLAALDETGEASPAGRAHHAIAAAALDLGRAVEAADRAAEAAVASLDHAAAGRWWLAAADLLIGDAPPTRTARLERQIRAGEALMRVGDAQAEEILFAAASAAADADDWDTAARGAIAVCRLGPTSMAGRPHQEATDLCDRVLARVEQPGLRASLAAATTMVHSMAGAVDRCRELFDQAELDAGRAGTDEAWLDVIPFAYMSVSGPADLDRREVLTDRLDAAATRLGRADGRWSARHLRFSNQLQRGDPALRSTAAELLVLADEVRERQRDWECCYVRATVAFLDGRLEESEEAITDTLAYVDTVAESRVLAVYGVQLLALRLVQHRLHELVDTIAGLAADQPTVGAWRAALALAAAQAGRTAVATDALDVALADDAALLAHDYAYTGALVALAEASALLGDADRGAQVRPLLEPWTGRWSWVGTCTLGPIDTSLARLCALVGDRERAVALADRALASARRLDAPVFARLARASFPDRADASGGMGY